MQKPSERIKELVDEMALENIEEITGTFGWEGSKEQAKNYAKKHSIALSLLAVIRFLDEQAAKQDLSNSHD